ncbi:folate-binding Fe/S cluster repair protein [Acinetobacter sp. MD2(2019)]|uniref:CAF17-like 4Fe-4S cluster assembly/insertion protein YgfZ n=1 Tax=Acinetobacter sp. MD2(2019) TaxID=2605273 RepID=UPI002D1E6D2D|nr:folate-binding Fe/S cluster repair protein [Acinetobacter sp. MD2(2019)]MEB3753687.1 folate-binding Fe/S cluster repair protein [Acinetobacter sp. MD2(2019)]
MNDLAFIRYQLKGVDALKFLQGQVTVHVERVPSDVPCYTAICDLKGRIQFGLWLKQYDPEHFEIVVTQNQSEEFAKHIKKYGAFSKMTLSDPSTVYPKFNAENTVFVEQATDLTAWQLHAIELGQAFIEQSTAHEFQPQELRLHQRAGIHYDKGCYLGQEIVARLWFKAKPKHWLHLVEGQGAVPNMGEKLSSDVQIVNSAAYGEGFKALVVAKPESITALGLHIVDLPDALNGDVARPKT